MNKFKNLKLLLAITASTTPLALGSDLVDIENAPLEYVYNSHQDAKKPLPQSDEGDLDFEENPLPQFRKKYEEKQLDLCTQELKPTLDIAAYFIPAIQSGNTLSGINAVVNARPRSLAEEVFGTPNSSRFIQLGILACTPYEVELNEKNLDINPSDRSLGINILIDNVKKMRGQLEKNDFFKKTIEQNLFESVRSSEIKDAHSTIRESVRTAARFLTQGLKVFEREDKGNTARYKKFTKNFNLLTFDGLLDLNADLITSYEKIFELITKDIYANSEATIETLNEYYPCLKDLEDIKLHTQRFLDCIEKSALASQKETRRIDIENYILNTKNTLTKDMRLDVVKTFSRNGEEHSGSIAVQWKNNNNNNNSNNEKKEIEAVYVMFAGTKSLSDVSVDFNFLKATIDPVKNGEDLGDNVHAGFYQAVFGDSSFQDALKSIMNKSSPDTQFYTIGHSLGAAMATIAAKTIKNMNKQAHVKVFTLAAPMPYGNTEEVENIFKDIGYDNMIYLDNHNDMVPVSTFPVGCSQIGTHFTVPVLLSAALEQGSLPVVWHHFSGTYMNAAPDLFTNIQRIITMHKMIFDQSGKIDLTKFKENFQEIENKKNEISNYYRNPSITNYLRQGAGVGSQVFNVAAATTSAVYSIVSYTASFANPFAYGSNKKEE